ncbi:hypothetical protein MIMGU_mgv1a021233mg [Erythranthe guttata]|uniref:F-box domain-containing protein n=1 Tax=Erythranthe guttata TaxID=4155 RepID=A0A022QAC7_ERYGU|nr:PREDICTED: F-box protein CPR30-like [Erythranthe guttata]EYU24906.1 hypothetical protein MIMGU_mgv1a021233mg [Erythranthe guttata]|eukprot:XP_012852421.1 PREDICTED: F-box protein CPR30-like [Erythranthe guttata]
MSDYFPAELQSAILQKLPVKSLIRFTTVCKSWRSIITSPNFIQSHLSEGKNHTQILLKRFDQTDEREHFSLLNLVAENGALSVNSSSHLEFPVKSRTACSPIVGCCDGVVCLLETCSARSSPKDVILWNPSIRTHLVLPTPTINPKESHMVVLGFGSDANHAHHKVVRLVYKPNDFGAEVFSVKTRSWRRLSGGVGVALRALKTGYCQAYCQAFLNGVVHWLALNPVDRRASFLAFDVGDEVFGEVMLPDCLASECLKMLCIFVIGESLGVVKYNKGYESWDVWAMKEYRVKESWTKMYTVEVSARVVGFRNSGEALLALRSLGLVVYNLKTKQMQSEDLGIYGCTMLFYVDNYVESLLLL